MKNVKIKNLMSLLENEFLFLDVFEEESMDFEEIEEAILKNG